MQTQSQKIEGWDHTEQSAPFSHRLQLKPLQQIIAKAKGMRPKHQLRIHIPKQIDTHDQSSYFSLRSNRNKCKTEEIYRKQSLIKIKQTEQKQQKLQIMPIYYLDNHKVVADIYNNIAILHHKQELSLKTINNESFTQLTHITPKEKHRHKKSKSVQTMMQINNLKANIKPHKKLIEKKIKTDINSKQCLVVIKQSKETAPNKNHKNIKSFFLRTLQGMHDISSIQSLESTKSKKKTDIPKDSSNEKRWKHMLERSNKRKKQLEQLFKTRPLFGKKEIQRRVGQSKLQVFLSDKSRKNYHEKITKTQFDDKSLYCPWTYKEERLAIHLKAKQLS